MARLIPGWVRNQGIDLYNQGLVVIEAEKDGLIEAEVDGHKLSYGIDDSAISCQCEFYGRKKYCQHIAALEYFLKNNNEGKVISQQLASQTENKAETEKMTSFGSLFWMV